MSASIGIIGLGRIGLAAAKAFLRDGYHVTACDVDSRALAELQKHGGTPLRTPEEVARQTKVVLVLVLNDEQVLEITTGRNGLLNAASHGSAIVCMSTVGQGTIRNISAACKKTEAGFLDCPFTGGVARLEARNLTLIAAGDSEVLNRTRATLERLGKIVYAGSEPGQAQAVKHCNQLLVGVTHAATMEVIVLARKLGLDPALVASVAGQGIAGSDYFRMLSESVLSRTPSPGGLGQMCKDMAIVKSTMASAEVSATVSLAAAEYFRQAQDAGMSGHEGADLIEIVEKYALRQS